MVSLDIRKPMDVMGRALSQKPVCAAFEAKNTGFISLGCAVGREHAERLFCNCSVPKRLLTVDFVGWWW